MERTEEKRVHSLLDCLRDWIASEANSKQLHGHESLTNPRTRRCIRPRLRLHIWPTKQLRYPALRIVVAFVYLWPTNYEELSTAREAKSCAAIR
jgi:hypothetical protein